ncbi:MAG: DMT family transporter [Pseudomonadota bacterium]|nr:DMT family transporter [Pseudomonadota bacterium]
MTHRITGGISPGILLMMAAMLVVPFMDAAAKLLSSRYPVLQLIWARFFFHFLLVLPVVLYRHGTSVLSVPRPVLQLGRGFSLMLATGCFFAAIVYIPLADAIAIIFFDAVIVVALAPWVLREEVPPNRWAAAAIGFVAVLLIMRPGFAGFHWASLLALTAALFWALYFLSTRVLSGVTPPLVMLGWQSVAGFVLMTLLLPWFWVTPSFEDQLLMLVIGAAGAAGHLLLIRAFNYAEASLLAPLRYMEIIMQVLLGHWLFGDLPDLLAWVGIGLIVGVGVYLSRIPAKSRVQAGKVR